MDCERHEHLIIEIEQLKHNVQSNSDKIHNNKDSIDKLSEKITDVGYNRVSDHRDQKNLIKLVESMSDKIDKLVDGLENKVNNVDDRVRSIESKLAVNDYKTDSSLQQLSNVNKVVRNMNGWDIAKLMGLMIAFGGLVVSIIQAVGG